MNTYHIEGSIPEKNITLVRQQDGSINQSQESIDWEDAIKINFADSPGWVSYNDITYGAYTPLQVKLEIHTPKRTNLIKQIKATLDAFSSVAYVNDCSVIDLTAERIEDNEEYADLYIRPAEKENISLPCGDYIALDRYIGPIKNNTFDILGYPLSTEDYKKDKELRDYIRQQFAAQKKIYDDFEMTIHLSTVDIGVEMELSERLEKMSFEKYPVRRPDVDNCAYTILAALNGVLYDSPEQITKLHLLKTYYNPLYDRNRVWIHDNNKTKELKRHMA